MSETAESVMQARRKLCFRLAEDLDPGDEPYDIDKAFATLEAVLPMSLAEADAELEKFRSEPSKPRKPSQLAALKEAFGVDDAMEAIRRATYVRTQVNACHEVMAKDASQLAALTHRVEQADIRIKEYREKIEDLEMDKANYHDKWLNAAERVIVTESEVKRLREGIEAIKSCEWFNKDDLETDPFTMVGCDPLRKAFALIAQPSDQKEAEGASL